MEKSKEYGYYMAREEGKEVRKEGKIEGGREGGKGSLILVSGILSLKNVTVSVSGTPMSDTI